MRKLRGKKRNPWILPIFPCLCMWPGMIPILHSPGCQTKLRNSVWWQLVNNQVFLPDSDTSSSWSLQIVSINMLLSLLCTSSMYVLPLSLIYVFILLLILSKAEALQYHRTILSYFPGESNLNFLWEKSRWDNAIIQIKTKITGSKREKKVKYADLCQNL